MTVDNNIHCVIEVPILGCYSTLVFGDLDLEGWINLRTQNEDSKKRVQELGGRNFWYAHAYYTEEEFWNIYDRKRYVALRAKYHATYLPSVYDKVKVDFSAEMKARKESWVVWLLALFWNVWPLSRLQCVPSCH